MGRARRQCLARALSPCRGRPRHGRQRRGRPRHGRPCRRRRWR